LGGPGLGQPRFRSKDSTAGVAVVENLTVDIELAEGERISPRVARPRLDSYDMVVDGRSSDRTVQIAVSDAAKEVDDAARLQNRECEDASTWSAPTKLSKDERQDKPDSQRPLSRIGEEEEEKPNVAPGFAVFEVRKPPGVDSGGLCTPRDELDQDGGSRVSTVPKTSQKGSAGYITHQPEIATRPPRHSLVKDESAALLEEPPPPRKSFRNPASDEKLAQACDYLPFTIRDVPILLRKGCDNGYLVDNKLLKSQLAGLTCRNSKNMEDQGERTIYFGSSIDGIVEQSENGERWLKITTKTSKTQGLGESPLEILVSSPRKTAKDSPVARLLGKVSSPTPSSPSDRPTPDTPKARLLSTPNSTIITTTTHHATTTVITSNPSNVWQYSPVGEQRGIRVRRDPRLNSEPTEQVMQPGETFEVCEVVRDCDGILYLRLPNHRGWLFESIPGVGRVCVPLSQQLPINVDVPDSAKRSV